MLILHIETATQVCSVSLSEGDDLISIRESTEPNIHAKKVAPFIDEVLREANRPARDLSAVAVSGGPGSYTGLRIGVSSAKGMCYALDIPLISIPTLMAMARGFLMTNRNVLQGLALPPVLCPMIDARRMEVYTAMYDPGLAVMKKIHAEIIHERSFEDYTGNNVLFIFGSGAGKCKPLLEQRQNVVFMDVAVSSKFMIPLAVDKYRHGSFEDTAYYEPFYLKEFLAGKPRVKGLD
ncbi:MAG: tRNA (adenosine(37)-N6)-threonylcarbamoyltransferase complex dimerization subunit type 1 TsaB [Bacteroidales bacterium]